MKSVMVLLLCVGALMSASSASYAYGYYGHGYYGPHFYGPHYYGPDVILDVPLGPPPVYYEAPPTVYVAPPTQTYVEKAPSYAYYCRSPAGYYPQVPRCPAGWLKVVPDSVPPR
ncbi:hypothetical protein FHU10_4516 [Serratia fonticola]|uniref:Uncharacterized protein n=1 Tax=Serratia fonticola TaxID=47917 RepID=A0A559TB73_SERFO|nr:hypothetical protein [Serratia fonticola]TQI80609.1 hypothetical protein FHU09_3187 [Serratia fonticola]TQI97366.1 hypothetical protein FHU11_2857 [Serratia fonticola]TVZ71862.1 hypothetical protein FHU10_4516 [Serratia fonticola]